MTELSEEMTDYWLADYLFPEKRPQAKGYFQEDWDYVHKKLGKAHMTLKLLHKEYSIRAKNNNGIPYAYRTYCEHYQDYSGKYKVTMPLKHKPGQSMETDWAGGTLKLIDRITEYCIPNCPLVRASRPVSADQKATKCGRDVQILNHLLYT